MTIDLSSYNACPLGLTAAELHEILGNHESAFDRWMYGQTVMACDGRASCSSGPHGIVVYRSDLTRFLAGLPVVD